MTVCRYAVTVICYTILLDYLSQHKLKHCHDKQRKEPVMNPETTLRNLLTAAGPNPIIYTVLRRRGPSGLGNAIGAYVIIDGIPYDLIPAFCRATDRKAVRVLDAIAVTVQGVGADSGLYLARLIAAAAGVSQCSHRWI